MNLLSYSQKQSFISLQKKPGFVVSVVLTVSITLGVLLCVISLNDLLIRKPLPYPDQDRIVLTSNVVNDQFGTGRTRIHSYPGLVSLYEKQEEFEQAAMISMERHEINSLPSHPSVEAAFVTPEYFSILNAPLVKGRWLSEDETFKEKKPAVVISHKMWREYFDLSDDILDQTLTIRTVKHPIVGVLSPGFIQPQLSGLGVNADMWVSWEFNTTEPQHRDRWILMDNKYHFLGKLKEGVTATQAGKKLTQRLSPIWQDSTASHDYYKGWSVEFDVLPLKEVLLGNSRSMGLLLLAGALGLILIACVNISNLFMLRTAEKQRDLAIHAALGARRGALFKLLLNESLVLMSASLMIALIIAHVCFGIMQDYLSAVLPRVEELKISLVTVVSAVVISALLAWMFALISSHVINYRELQTTLQSSGKGSGLQVSKRTRQLLIVTQVALATVLIFANASLFKQAMDIIKDDRGFNQENTASLLLMTSEVIWPSQRDTYMAMEEFRRRLLEFPEVEAVSRSSGNMVPPLNWGVASEDGTRYTPYTLEIDEHYFSLMDQTLLAGRNLTSVDVDFWSGAANVDYSQYTREELESRFYILVDRAFAEKLTQGDISKAVGKKLTYREGWITNGTFTIVGVVENISLPTWNEGSVAVYLPRFAGQSRSIIKFKPGQFLDRRTIAELISDVDKRYAVSLYDNNDALMTRILFSQITAAITTSVLTVLVFFLAAIGLYSILNYGTQLRRYELGARMAVGAKAMDLIKLIVGDNARTVLLGLLLAALILFALVVGLQEIAMPLLDVQLVPILLLTLFAIIGTTFVGCYWPLREYVTRPVIYTLRASE